MGKQALRINPEGLAVAVDVGHDLLQLAGSQIAGRHLIGQIFGDVVGADHNPPAVHPGAAEVAVGSSVLTADPKHKDRPPA